jgi:transposase-like protein
MKTETTSKRPSAEFRAKVALAAWREDKAQSQLASEHGVHPLQIGVWRKQAVQALPAVFGLKAQRDTEAVAACQGRLTEAQNHAEQAVAIHPNHGEAFYQLAKVLMFRNEPEKAIPHLIQAITLDRNYMLKAATDLDFLKYEQAMNDAFDNLRKVTATISEIPLAEAEEKIQVMLNWRTRETCREAG